MKPLQIVPAQYQLACNWDGGNKEACVMYSNNSKSS